MSDVKPNRRQVLKTAAAVAGSPKSLAKAATSVISSQGGNPSASLFMRRLLALESYLNDRWLPGFAKVASLGVMQPTVPIGRDSRGYLECRNDGPPYIEAFLNTHGVETLSFKMPFCWKQIERGDPLYLKAYGGCLRSYLDAHEFEVASGSVTVTRKSDGFTTRYERLTGRAQVVKTWVESEAISVWESEGGAVMN